MEDHADRLLDSPIGTLNVGASARGLRLVQFPRDSERDQPFVTGEEAGGKPDHTAQAQLDEALQQLTSTSTAPARSSTSPWTGTA